MRWFSLFLLALGAQAFAADTLELRVANATVPPGGTLQFQVAPTTPKPIIRGRQNVTVALAAQPILGSLQGGNLFSPGGDASGFALANGANVQVSFNSTNALFGTELDTPSLVLLFPVLASAAVGRTTSLTLDAAGAKWVDPVTGQSYALTLTPGLLTVGGTLSVSNVTPGGNNVPAGAKVVIKGTGFQQGLKIKIGDGDQEVKVATITVVSPSEVDITLKSTANLTGAGIIITNPGNESVTYYSFQRTRPLSASVRPLLAAALPMFSTVNYSAAYFHPVLSGSTFSGIAMQNTGTATASIQLQLSSSSGLLGTALLSLPPNYYAVRDVSELFPGVVVPASGSTLQATTPAASVQMLGLIGSNSTKTITPVDPLLAP
jgi:hypothetical protein